MRRALVLWGLAALFLGMTAVGAILPSQDEAKKVLPEIEAPKKVAKKISKEAQAKIEAALGEKLAAEDLSPTLYEGKAMVPIISGTEKTRLLICIVNVKGPKGTIRVGVAASPEDKVIVAVRLLKNEDDKFLESPLFLNQFKEYEYTEHLYSPLTKLEEARKKAKDGDKDLALIFDLMTSMRGVGVRWGTMLEKIDASDATAADDAAAQKKAFQDVEKMIPRISFMKTAQIDRFKKSTADTIREYDKVVSFSKSKDFVGARKAANEIDSASCSKCHGSTQRLFKDERLKRGIGNGYFSPGYDLTAPDDKKEVAAATARGVRKALLLMAEAR